VSGNHGGAREGAGRPREWDRAELARLISEYVDSTTIPILAEFAAKLGIRRQFLYEYPELKDAVERLIAKKEGALEREALCGNVNCSMAIFSLKQLGWRDTHEATLKSDPAAPLAFTLLASDIPTDPQAT
jgi:hypothetical protein